MNLLRGIGLSILVLLGSCAGSDNAQRQTGTSANQASDFGVLVMAHGGGSQWNEGVDRSLVSIRDRYPVEIAFGMADAGSIEEAVGKLKSQGVQHVGVVRLFISGESWYDRTLQILGVIEGAPVKSQSNYQTVNPHMPMGFWQIETDLAFYVSKEGLAEAEEMDEVLLSRVSGLSTNPSTEVVAVIAHGPADDGENERWIHEITARTKLMQQELGVENIEVFTLREDWEEKRAGAMKSIRDYIEQANESGLTSIVVPYRVQGFGPYATVLEGLDYTADRLGLVPHENVSLWIENRIAELLFEVEEHKLQLGQVGN